MLQGAGCKGQSLELGAWGLVFRVQGQGFGGWDSGERGQVLRIQRIRLAGAHLTHTLRRSACVKLRILIARGAFV